MTARARAIASREVLRAALSDLPSVPSFDPSLHATGGGHGAWRAALSRRRYVSKTDTICYGPWEGANLADIWRRSDLPRDGRAPVLVHVPGGAWTSGRRRPQGYPLMSYLAERGWLCVSVNYRAGPRHAWPAHIVDVKRVVAWVKQNIAEYGGDPDFVAISGGSAGGHLAALTALTAGDPQFQPGFEAADTSVAAAVPLYGRYDWVGGQTKARRGFIRYLERFVVKRRFADDKQIYVDASPISRVGPEAPPFFVLHGVDDGVIPVGEARDFTNCLRMQSTSPVLYAELPGTGHGFDMIASPRVRCVVHAIGSFLTWVHAARTIQGD